MTDSNGIESEQQDGVEVSEGKPLPIATRGRKESAGVTTGGPIKNPGRKESHGLTAASMAPPTRKRQPVPPPAAAEVATKEEDPSTTKSSSPDEGSKSLEVPAPRVVQNPFGVEDISNKIIHEGMLGINLLTKRYFVLYGSGTVYLYKSEAQKEKSSTAEQLTNRLLTITPAAQKKIKGQHWVTFHFDNGSTKHYKTSSVEDQQQWVDAGNRVKAS